MNEAKVSIVRAYEYDYAQLYEAIGKSIKLIGGLERIVRQSSGGVYSRLGGVWDRRGHYCRKFGQM